MRCLRARRPLVTWIAIFAILWAALAPSLAHALGTAKTPSWKEVCSVDGAKKLQDDADGSGDPAAPAHVFEHCPFCSLHLPALGMPPIAEVDVLDLRLRDEVPLAFFVAPRTPHAWISAQPRAPPILV